MKLQNVGAFVFVLIIVLVISQKYGSKLFKETRAHYWLIVSNLPLAEVKRMIPDINWGQELDCIVRFCL